jgi:hypothetical protein
MVIDDHQLGTEIKSEHCDKTFFADWGSPVIVTEDEAGKAAATTLPASAGSANKPADPNKPAEQGAASVPNSNPGSVPNSNLGSVPDSKRSSDPKETSTGPKPKGPEGKSP